MISLFFLFYHYDITITKKVAKNVDRELVEQIRLAVVVEDIATQTDRQQTFGHLTIIVDDENDNNPVFKERVYKRSISENSPVGSVIANIAATDQVCTASYHPHSPSTLFLNPIEFRFRRTKIARSRTT